MTSPLQVAFNLASPRITPRPMRLPAMLIYLAVVVLWGVLFSRSFWIDNIWVWSAGIVYIVYDTILMLLVVWLTLPLHWAMPARHRSAPKGERASLGIVIAAHNEASNLPVALAAIMRQSDAVDLILIADDGSSDGTDHLLQQTFGLAPPELGRLSDGSARMPALRWLRLPHQGKASALNAAIGHMETDIVLMLDADTFLADDAVAEIRAAFDHEPNLVGAGGVLVPVCDATPGGRILQLFQTYEYVRNMISRFAWMRPNCLLLISGAFSAFRRDALVAVGGLDPDSLVEDYELTHRMHRYAFEHGLPWQLRMVGSAVAKTEAPSNVVGFLRQRRRWFAGFLQTQYRNRDMTGNRRYGAVGTYMLPIKALDTMQPIYGLTAFILLVALLVTGHTTIAVPVFGIIGAKIAADFAVYLWTVHLYRRLTGGRTAVGFGSAVFAAVAEPFSFQILRHSGAAWGWLAFLTGSKDWGLRSPAPVLALARGGPPGTTGRAQFCRHRK